MSGDEYLNNFQQSTLMKYAWRFIMVLSFANMVIFLFVKEWHEALTEFIILMFVIRINMFECHVSEINAEKEKNRVGK